MSGTRARLLKRVGLVLSILFIGIQFIPVDRTNPAVTGEIPASEPVKAILQRSCYDCHSNTTVWPWYSHVAPVSFVVARDVHEARRHANFSVWNTYTPQRQAKVVKEVGEQVAKGEMPMTIYLPMHPAARLSEQDKAVIADWVKVVTASSPPSAPGEPARSHE